MNHTLFDSNSYISNMKIKKSVIGGYDTEDVLKKMKYICEMYQCDISNLSEIVVQTKSELNQLQKDRDEVYEKYFGETRKLSTLIAQIEETKRDIFERACSDAENKAEELRLQVSELDCKKNEQYQFLQNGYQSINTTLNNLKMYIDSMQKKLECNINYEAEKEKSSVE